MARVYIAGGMNGYPDNNFPLFDAARDFLLELGEDPVSPADIDRERGITEDVTIEPFSPEWQATLRRDAIEIAQCDKIAFLPRWEHSIGAKKERRMGWEMGVSFWRIDPYARTYEPEMLVGLSGYARVGKDTAAEFLEVQGWSIRGFAAALKEILYALNPIVDPEQAHLFSLDGSRVSDFVDMHGWVDAKKEPEIRQLLQRLGTDAGRNILGHNIWVRALLENPISQKLIIPDVRFPNEAEAIKERGGVIIRIERPDYGPVNNHISETALDKWKFEYRVLNDSTPLDLGHHVSDIVRHHYGKTTA